MAYEFDWDPAKADQNVRKHGVTFEEATTVFADPLATTVTDSRHSDLEHRYVLLGRSERGRLLVVMHTERRNAVRIISARPANSREIREYEEGDGDDE